MKTVPSWIFLGVLLIGLVHERAPLRAQPADKDTPADRAPAAPKGLAEPTTDAPAQSDDDPIVTDDDDNKPWSQGVSAENRKAARKLFLEGNRLFRVPLFAKAAEQYMAALGKWKHPAFYFNLALAQLNLGKEVDARESLEQALQYGEAPLGAEQFHEAQKQLKEVRRQLGQIRVTCRTPGAEVTMDGMTLFIGPGSYQGWTKAKTHELTAKKAGYLSEAQRVTVSSEGLRDVELKLVTLSQATDASRRWAAWKPWAVVAAGGLIAAGGGGLHALAARSFDDYDKEVSRLCSTPAGDPPRVGCTQDEIDPELAVQLQRARRQQVIAVSSYVVGGSLVATGIVLLYMNRPRIAEQAGSSLSAGGVELTPVVSTDMLGLQLSMSH